MADAGTIVVDGGRMPTMPTFNRFARTYTIGGVEFHLAREGLARDGGDPPRWWYWVIVENGQGYIDGRVADGYFRTKAIAWEALRHHLVARGVVDG
jgi:hypothetical protein